MRASIVLLFLTCMASGADTEALNAKCNTLLMNMKQLFQTAASDTDEEKAYNTEIALLCDSMHASTDTELKYRFLRWQNLAIINSCKQGLRIQEKKGKDSENTFYRLMKSQLDEAQQIVMTLDGLHAQSK